MRIQLFATMLQSHVPCDPQTVPVSTVARRQDAMLLASKISATALGPLMIVVWLTLGSGVAKANDVYIAQSSAGGNTGADCADALKYTYFNLSNSWTSSAPTGTMIGPGTTVHLCGIFNGTQGQNDLLSAQGSGSSSNPITIKFETGANLTSPDWGSPVIYLSGNSYITIDGGTNGIIQNTDNGTGLTYHNGDSVAIQALYGSSTIEVKNLTVANLYVHAKCEASSGCDTAVDQTTVNVIQFNGSNILIHDNTFHDIGWAIYQDNATGTTNNIQIYNNVIYNMDHGVTIGAGASSVVSNEYIYNNHFHDMAAWDTGQADNYHHDGIHAFSGAGGKIQNLYLYNNLFDGDEGDCCVTAWVFLEGIGGGTQWTDTTGTAYVWNNVVIGSNTSVPYGQMSINVGNGHEVFNNTFIGASSGGETCFGFGTTATQVVFENNLIEGCNTVIGTNSATSIATMDYNIYGNASGGNVIWNFGSMSANVLSTWQTTCGCDAHSQAQLGSALADVSSEGVPSLGFIGIGAGANLSSTATGTLASLASDTSAGGQHSSVARPSSGPWTIGAYNYTTPYSTASATLSGSTVH